MNFYTLAAKTNRKIAKDAERILSLRGASTIEEAREHAKKMAMNEYDDNCKLGIELMLRYKSIAKDMGLIQDKLKQHFFITVRPNPIDTTFEQFYEKVYDFVNRKCFINYKLTFEQKGTNDEDIGTGFHCHIIAHMTQHSKGQVLRDTQSTFKHMASANCIQVDILKTNDDLKRVTGYIEDYEADDNHKIVTKEWDEKWRAQKNLQAIYTHLPAIKSELAGEHNNNFTIEFL